jgi:fumarate reductase (CoM/CoB) subunit A
VFKLSSGESRISTDVLIIGGGGAALRAAVEAHKFNVSITLVCSNPIGKGGCTSQTSSEILGINAALADEDSPETHYQDIVRVGQQCSDLILARTLAYNSPIRLNELAEMGVPFEKENSKLKQIKFTGNSYPRACYVGNRTGVKIINALMEIIKDTDINIQENIRIVKLISNQSRVIGALGINLKTLSEVIINAKSTILATGGGGQLYSLNVNNDDVNGDGYILAFDIGAELVNMGFIQFGPGVVYPKTRFIIHGPIWRLRPILTNGKGEPFIHNYCEIEQELQEVFESKAANFPFSVDVPSMKLDMSIYTEIIENRGTENKGVKIIFPTIGNSLELRSPHLVKTLRNLGFDLENDNIEIANLAHHFIGGVKINGRAQTNIPGLYAAGEVAGGIHGANRPGGDSLAACQVFGHIAGENAAMEAAKTKSFKIKEEEIVTINKKDSLLGFKGKTDVKQIIENIRRTAWHNIAIIRDEAGITEFLRKIQKISGEYKNIVDLKNEDDLLDLISLLNFLKLGWIIGNEILLRKESRGTHFRKDYPYKDDKLGYMISLNKEKIPLRVV